METTPPHAPKAAWSVLALAGRGYGIGSKLFLEKALPDTLSEPSAVISVGMSLLSNKRSISQPSLPIPSLVQNVNT